jgi:CHAT domain-containing protein
LIGLKRRWLGGLGLCVLLGAVLLLIPRLRGSRTALPEKKVTARNAPAARSDHKAHVSRILLPGGDPLNREISGSEDLAYEVFLEKGQVFSADVEAQGTSVVVTLVDPANRSKIDLEIPAELHFERLATVATTRGVHLLRVRPRVSGRLSLRLARTGSATAADEMRAEWTNIVSSGDRLRRQNSFEKALDRFRVAASHTGGDPSAIALTYFMTARAHLALEQLDEAQRAYGKAHKWFSSAHKPAAAAFVEERIGEAQYFAHDLQKAAGTLERAALEASRAGSPGVELEALSNLALVHKTLENWQKALEDYGRSAERARELDRRSYLGVLYGNLGQLYLDMGKPKESLDHFRQALDIQLGVPGESESAAWSLGGAGMAHLALGSTEESLRETGEAVVLAKQGGGLRTKIISLIRRGVVLLEVKQAAQARDCFEEATPLARKLGDPKFEGIVAANLAWTRFLQGDSASALQLFRKASSLFRGIGDHGSEAQALYGSAKMLHQLGRLPDALADVESSIDITELLRTATLSQDLRSSFFAKSHQRFELAVELLMKLDARNPGQGFGTRAFEMSERGRARSVLDELVEAQADIRAGVSRTILAKEENLRQQIQVEERNRRQLERTAPTLADLRLSAAAKDRIQTLVTDHDRMQAEIRAKSPRYAALVQPQPRSLQEIQKELLDSESLLLSYSLGESKSFLWLVGRDRFESYELPGRAKIERAARDLWDKISLRGSVAQRGVPAVARRLGEMLLTPVAGKLNGSRLLIIPDGALHYVPFTDLPEPDTTGGAPRILLESHEVVVLPSASAISLLRQERGGRRPAPLTVAVIADAVFQANDSRVHPQGKLVEGSGPRGLPRLPSSREEAAAILALVPPEESLVALDFDANLKTVMNPELRRYRFIHLATHGTLDEQPVLSRLIFSLVDEQGRAQNGYLHAFNVYNLDLQADLVVLSACQTALGDEMGGEGVGRLTRGFLYAGAKSVIVSLWNVSDRASARLMADLYAGMLRKGLRPSAALRAAQLEVRKQKQNGWDSPFYWAGFVLQGDWK